MKIIYDTTKISYQKIGFRKILIIHSAQFFVCATLFVSINSSGWWQGTNYLWSFGVIAECNARGFRPSIQAPTRAMVPHEEDYKDLHAGDVVWVQCHHVKRFCDAVLPTLNVPIILYIGFPCGVGHYPYDFSFPSECGVDIHVLLDNPYIVHIFTENNDYVGTSTKITPIPLGIGFWRPAVYPGCWGAKGLPREQEAELEEVLKNALPTCMRKKRAFIDFQLANHGSSRPFHHGESRADIFKHLVSTKLVDYGPQVPRLDLWKIKSQYAFSISPHGLGLDCYRTWEDLILGCIVIVKTSTLDSLYDGLPVVIVKDWTEITAKNFDLWLARYGDAFTNPSYREKLKLKYWTDKILNLSRDFRDQKKFCAPTLSYVSYVHP